MKNPRKGKAMAEHTGQSLTERTRRLGGDTALLHPKIRALTREGGCGRKGPNKEDLKAQTIKGPKAAKIAGKMATEE